MVEPPPAPPQPLPPLPQPPPVPQFLVAAAPQGFSATASSMVSRRRLMAEPPLALPQPMSHGPVVAAPLTLSSNASSTASATPTSPSGHVAQNPRIGDSGEVESGAVAPTAEALPKINYFVGTIAAAPLPQISMPDEEDGVVDEWGSTSLSAICARAYCRRAKKTSCKWRIHVGRLDDQETMEVKVHVEEHTCSSTKKKKKQRNASKAWVCEKVMDWVREDPSVRPMEFRRRLVDKYKIKVHYTFQVSVKPCKHAISFITGIRGVTIEDIVDDCYSVAKFAAAYAPILPGLTNMSQWPSVNKEFFLNPTILRRAPGRPKVQRHKSGAENSKGKGKKGQHQCPICKAYGHRWQSCKDAAPEALEAYAEVAKQKRDKRKKKPITKSICTTSDQAMDGTLPLLLCPSENETALALLSCPSDAIEDGVAKSTSSKTTSKSRRSKVISAAPDSPAMGHSKQEESCA